MEETMHTVFTYWGNCGTIFTSPHRNLCLLFFGGSGSLAILMGQAGMMYLQHMCMEAVSRAHTIFAFWKYSKWHHTFLPSPPSLAALLGGSGSSAILMGQAGMTSLQQMCMKAVSQQLTASMLTDSYIPSLLPSLPSYRFGIFCFLNLDWLGRHGPPSHICAWGVHICMPLCCTVQCIVYSANKSYNIVCLFYNENAPAHIFF